MQKGPRPQNRIALPVATDLKSLVDATLVAPDGAWHRLLLAHTQLQALMQTHFYVSNRTDHPNADDAERYKLANHHPELSLPEEERLLISDWGLDGEFGNGPQMLIHAYLESNYRPEPYEKKVERVIDSFLTTSQLGRDRAGWKLGVSGEKDGVVKQENKLDAMGRCANEVEAWVAFNSERIAPEDQRVFAHTLATYRAAFGEVAHRIATINELLVPSRIEGKSGGAAIQ